MSTTAAATATTIPTGSWQVDRVHSSIGFEVKHMVVSTFRGQFGDYDAELVSEEAGAKLTGTVRVASVEVKDENLAAHLQGPDFFDAERTPELRFESDSLELDGDELVLEGRLTVRGVTNPIEARGSISGPHEDFNNTERVGVALTTVLDRTAYGLEWNAPLPKGGFALANDVKLVVNLEFTRAS